MPSLEDYRAVKLESGELVNQIKNFTQDEWVFACRRLGLSVRTDRGKDSHIAVYRSDDCLSENSECLVVTLQGNMYPNLQRGIVKRIVFYGIQSGKYTEDAVWEALKVKKG